MKIIKEQCGMLTIEIERAVLADILEQAQEGIRSRRDKLREIKQKVDHAGEREEILLKVNKQKPETP